MIKFEVPAIWSMQNELVEDWSYRLHNLWNAAFFSCCGSWLANGKTAVVMWLADACSNGQLVPWCSLKTYHHPQSATLSFHPVAMRLITSCSFIRLLWLADVAWGCTWMQWTSWALSWWLTCELLLLSVVHRITILFIIMLSYLWWFRGQVSHSQWTRFSTVNYRINMSFTDDVTTKYP